MKIGADGSLPRITSPLKDIASCVKIVKVPDDQVKESELLYKLVWIGSVGSENDQDCLSDKSDEELWSEDDTQAILPAEDEEKNKDTDSKTEDRFELNEHQSKESVKSSDISTSNKYNTSYNPVKRNFRACNRQSYDSFNSSTFNMEENNYYTNKRRFSGTKNYDSYYDKPVDNVNNANAIDPWVTPPITNYSYPCYPFVPVPQQTPPNPNAETFGLLGDSPYSQTNFLSGSQNNNYMHGRNYWINNNYPPNDYKRTGAIRAPMPVLASHEPHYPRKKHWRNWNNPRKNRNNPYRGGNRSNPNRGENRSNPNRGENRSNPNRGENRSNPNRGKNRSNPNRGENRSNPNHGENRINLNHGENRSNPNHGENRNNHKHGEYRNNHKYGENKNNSKDGENRNNPKHGENRKNPNTWSENVNNTSDNYRN